MNKFINAILDLLELIFGKPSSPKPVDPVQPPVDPVQPPVDVVKPSPSPEPTNPEPDGPPVDPEPVDPHQPIVYPDPQDPQNPPVQSPSQPPVSIVEQELLATVNKYRYLNGLPALVMDIRLLHAARKHSNWMALNRTMSHNGQNGWGPAQRASAENYIWSQVGENVAAGYKHVPDVVGGWKNSPGHNKIMLSSYVNVGFGYATSDKSYWCALFASPSTMAAATSQSDSMMSAIFDGEFEKSCIEILPG